MSNITGGKDAIAFCIERGIMRGTSADKFSPNMPITIGMIATILGNMSDIDANAYKNTKFSDIKGKYYTNYINLASEKGIVKGFGENKFKPEKQITREQLAVMIVQYAKAMNIHLPSAAKLNYSDNSKISAWAKESVAIMQASGIMKGKGENNFDPKATATRAEVCVVIQKFLNM